MRDLITYLKASNAVTEKLIGDEAILESISFAAAEINRAIVNGKKIFACGNGGSMCDAIHFASELTGKYRNERRPLAAIALSDIGAMSCIANDFGYSEVFARHITALGAYGDVLMAISTSGASANVLSAMIAAQKQGMGIIGLTGASPADEFLDHCDVLIRVPSTLVNHIQETHMKILHLIVELIEKEL